MKLAIVGAGMTGAYLHRLLRAKGPEIDVYDRKPDTRCGINPCAWGTSRGFEELVRDSGLDPGDYLLRRLDHVMLDGVRIGADLMTFDKGKLIHDLLQGARVRYSSPDPAEYDRIIDATGPERAFLPPIADDIVLACTQYRIRTDSPLENRIQFGNIGYAWTFPLGACEYHIGCGCLLADPRSVLRGLGWAGKRSCPGETICACSGRIRLTGPGHSRPFFSRLGKCEVWGVGEAIGCVGSIAGDGIVPGMRSVIVLLGHWDDPGAYEKAILGEFGWIEREREVMDKLRRNDPLSLRDAWSLKRVSGRMGINVGVRRIGALIRNLR